MTNCKPKLSLRVRAHALADLSANNKGKFVRERSFRDFAETETLEKLETFLPEERCSGNMLHGSTKWKHSAADSAHEYKKSFELA